MSCGEPTRFSGRHRLFSHRRSSTAETEELTAFIDAHREVYGVEPICRMLPIAPSTYYEVKAREKDPSRLPARTVRDRFLGGELRRVWDENRCVYGYRKMWRQFGRESIPAARCTVERLMRKLGLKGAVRGRKPRTTMPDKTVPRPLDLVNREFTASGPNSALGGRSDLCGDLVGVRLCGIRHRCLFPNDRGLESVAVFEERSGS